MAMTEAMVDLETLDVTADAVIMSIGAVAFDMNGVISNDGFYTSVSIDSNTALGRRISEPTIVWWMQQDTLARKFFTEDKLPLDVALTEFTDWFNTIGDPDDLRIWSNGASFDIPMLEHAYRQIDSIAPWKFWNARCVRTYKALPGAKDVKFETSGVKHNALSDAINQARQVQAIHKALFTPKGTK